MLLLAGMTAMVAARPLKDNSFLTHLATGRLILAEGVPETNPFLFTGTAFPVPSWWWSILVGVAERVGGGGAIRLLTAALGATLAVVLVRLAASGASSARPTRDAAEGDAVEGDGWGPTLLTLAIPSVLAILCTFALLNPRPHLLGYLLLALTILAWERDRSPWWIVAILAVWVNVHGSWVFGVAILGGLAVARSVDDRRLRRSDLLAVLGALAGVVSGGLVYPDRLALVLLPTRQFGDEIEREALSTYKEWSAPGFDRPMVWGLLALGLLAVLGCLRHRRHATAILAAGLVAIGLSGVRFVPVAAIALVPFAALGLPGITSLRLPAGRAARTTSAIGVAFLLVAGTTSVVGDPYDLRWYPVEAVDWLEERDLIATPEVRVLHHDYIGNYLEWRYGVDAHAFVDDRPDAVTLIDYVQILYLEQGWQEAFERAGPDVVLWAEDKPLTEQLGEDADWLRSFEANDFVVWCRADIAPRCT